MEINDDRLLRALAEQLKLPLVQIARQAELTNNPEVLKDIMHTASTAIQLIDGLLLSADMHAQQVLPIEPVSISSVFYAVSEDLKHHAKQYNCEVQISLGGRYRPIMGNFEALRAAFATLGHALIEAHSSNKSGQIMLAAHRNSHGIVAGVFGQQPEISADMFRRARALFGSAKQPLVSSESNSAAGIFIADSLLGTIAKPLQVAKHNKLSGLATVLLPSQQLKLV